MQINLQQSPIRSGQTVVISGSKSESNRLLLLQKLVPTLVVENIAHSDDVVAMQKGLRHATDEVDVHHAGTAMRFLTAYFALCQERKIQLRGSERMHQRPISILVDALRELGAKITYLEEEGFPPLEIQGIQAFGGEISLPAHISSQYISALLLVGVQLKWGIKIQLLGEITSRPYIEMTLALLNELGAKTKFEGHTITVFPGIEIKKTHFTVEADWSSASYYYSLIALSPIGTTIRLGKYKEISLQGDARLQTIYEKLGVQTRFESADFICLTKVENEQKKFEADFIHTPDLAQTVVVTCFGLGIACTIKGLHTLKIKETDRLVALQNELEKLGGEVIITADSLSLAVRSHPIKDLVAIDTYQDHRMAMAFAPLVLKTNLKINEAEVVSKSYPEFWKDLIYIGILASKREG